LQFLYTINCVVPLQTNFMVIGKKSGISYDAMMKCHNLGEYEEIVKEEDEELVV
jgi:hypothetical protein